VKPRLLDLFCGAGGAAMGYHRAGFEVVGVDIKPQPNYPFEFVQSDALSYLLPDEVSPTWNVAESFDAIHASPPCQALSTLRVMPNAHEHQNLIPATREMLEQAGLLYVIENVVGARPHLRHPFLLCGSSFGLRVWRHRLFETNWEIGLLPPCSHVEHPDPLDVTGDGGGRRKGLRPDCGGGNSRKPRGLAEASDALDIDWMSRRELSQAIPPAYTELIGHQLLQHIHARAVA
jgi:DNA (cytosine-5)-methyltransferase 1